MSSLPRPATAPQRDAALLQVATSGAGRPWWVRHAARLLGIALVTVVLLLYAPTLDHEFLSYDDPAYVTANVEVLGGLSLDNLRWALTSTGSPSWQPVTWLSHMLDIELHGERSGRHHATSALLHALNALLLFLALRSMTGSTGRAGLVAAFFAFHPVNAESVAWVSARQDVLAGTFALLVVHAHLSFARTRRPAMAFWLAVAFTLGLATKPILVTLPLALLLLDFWPLERMREGVASLLREKSFLFVIALAATAVVIAVLVMEGSDGDLAGLSFAQRVANALVSAPRYMAKLVWPSDLAILYPHPQAAGGTPWAVWQIAGSAAFLAGITGCAWYARRRAPYLLVGWGWFLLMLLPVSGIVQFGPQAMADRYAYLPSIGLYLGVVWGAADLAASSPRLRHAAVAASCASVVALTSATAHHLRHFESSDALWRRSADVHPESWIAHNELGNLRYAEGRVAAAIDAYRKAVALEPNEPSLYNDLAWVLATTEESALRDGEAALALAQRAARATSYQDPGYLDTLAAAYATVGRYEVAVTWADRAAVLADEQGEDVLAHVIRSHAARFREGRALHPDAD